MKSISRSNRLVPFFLLASAVTARGASGIISVYENAPTPIRHAAHRLSHLSPRAARVYV